MPVAATARAVLPIVSPEIVRVTATLAAMDPPVNVTARDVVAKFTAESVMEAAPDTDGTGEVANRPAGKLIVISCVEDNAPPNDGVNTSVAATLALFAVEPMELMVSAAAVTALPTAGQDMETALPSSRVDTDMPVRFGPDALLPIVKPDIVITKAVLAAAVPDARENDSAVVDIETELKVRVTLVMVGVVAAK